LARAERNRADVTDAGIHLWREARAEEVLMLSIRIPGAAILGATAALTLAACGGTISNGPGAAASPSSSALIHTATITVAGKSQTVLKNQKGLTLYYFTPDTATAIACTGGCASTWPPLLSPSGAPTSNPSLGGKLSVLNGPNGNQVLYNGHPLYTYQKDGDPGDAYGQGLFGKWFAATPDLAAAATPGSGYKS
jgi:predicted lipoprotein with Yx(FWY)xxD motif